MTFLRHIHAFFATRDEVAQALSRSADLQHFFDERQDANGSRLWTRSIRQCAC
jgi:hypothetical protein